MTQAQPDLYGRLGGDPGIENLVRCFYARVLADTVLAPFFRNTSMDKLARMQREFLGAALDGPQSLTRMDLSCAHHGRGITAEHFNRFFQHLLTTLTELGAAQADVDEVVHRIALYKNHVTGEAY